MHICKERFSEPKRSKLLMIGYGQFQILEIINDNAYKVDLLSEYGVTTIFNVYDLSLFDVGDDSMLNPFEEKMNNVIQTIPIDPLKFPVGSIIRSWAKKLKDTFNELI